jgi:hypothetical protein
VDEEVGELFPFQINLYQSNPLNDKIYLMHVMDYPAGYHIEVEDTAYKTVMVEELMALQPVPVKLISSRMTELQGYPAFFMDILTEEPVIPGAPNFYYRFFFVMRNSRIYRQVAVMQDGDQNDEDVKKYFESLKLLDYKERAEYKPCTLFDGEMEILFPQKPFTEIDSFTPDQWDYEGILFEKYYYSKDNALGQSFTISTSVFDEYYQEESLDSALNDYYENQLAYYDSVHWTKWDTTGVFKSWELIGQHEGISSFDRVKVMLDGNKYHFLFTKLHPKDIKRPEVNSVFASMKLTGKASEWSMFTDKTDKILADITHQDTLKQQLALRALERHTFDSTRINALYDILKADYTAYDSAFQVDVKDAAVAGITNMELGTAGKIEALNTCFKLLPDFLSGKKEIIDALVGLETSEGVESAKNLILRNPDVLQYRYGLSEYTWSISDSAQELLTGFFPDLYSLCNEDANRFTTINMLSLSLIEDTLMEVGNSDEFRTMILRAAQQAVDKTGLEGMDAYSIEIFHYTIIRGLDVLEADGEVIGYLRHFAENAARDERLRAAEILLEMGEEVDEHVILKTAEDPSSKLALMRAYEKQGLSAPFSKKSYKQETISMLMVQSDQYDYDEGEYYDLAAIKLFKKYKVKALSPEEEELKEGWMYVFQVKYDPADEWSYIGVGLQPYDKKAYSLKESLLYYFWNAEEANSFTEAIKDRFSYNDEFELIE